MAFIVDLEYNETDPFIPKKEIHKSLKQKCSDTFEELVNESFYLYDEIKKVIFPNLYERKTAYFIAVLSLIQISIYISMAIKVNDTNIPDNESSWSNISLDAIKNGEIWRLITPILTHQSFLHIFFNISFQLGYGIYLESRFGYLYMILIYFISQIAGALSFISFVSNHLDHSIGASGAIYGIIGMYLVDGYLNRETRKMFLYNILFTVFLSIGMILEIVISRIYHIAIFGHIGGILAGIFLSLLIIQQDGTIGLDQTNRLNHKRRIQLIGGILLLLQFISYITIIIIRIL